jgi:hypothetical protein
MIITFACTFDFGDSCGHIHNGELYLFKSSLYYFISIVYIILMLLYKNNNIRK